jgi:uncharacterized lipoprotein YajG
MRYEKIVVVTIAIILLAGCSSEPRSIAYFEKNVDEARAVVADTGVCSGVDRTKIMSGSDECTNAHIALDLVKVAEKNKRISDGIDRSLKDGSWMPKAGN